MHLISKLVDPTLCKGVEVLTLNAHVSDLRFFSITHKVYKRRYVKFVDLKIKNINR